MKWCHTVPVPLLHLSDQLVSGELSPDDQDQALDDILRAVHVEQTANHNRQTAGIHLGHTLNKESSSAYVLVAETESRARQHFQDRPYLLDVDLDVLLQVVAVQVEDEVVDKVEAVADDDERQLVGEFGFLSTTHTLGGTSHNQSNTSITTPDATWQISHGSTCCMKVRHLSATENEI